MKICNLRLSRELSKEFVIPHFLSLPHLTRPLYLVPVWSRLGTIEPRFVSQV